MCCHFFSFVFPLFCSNACIEETQTLSFLAGFLCVCFYVCFSVYVSIFSLLMHKTVFSFYMHSFSCVCFFACFSVYSYVLTLMHKKKLINSLFHMHVFLVLCVCVFAGQLLPNEHLSATHIASPAGPCCCVDLGC